MSTPLTTDDVKRMEDREALTTMTDADTFIIHDTSELKIKKITKVNAKEDLGINDKADKDADAVEGNFASFDSEGNPVDSGIAPSDKEDADETILKQEDIVDALDSTSTTAPLSANQGKVLKDTQDAIKGTGWTDETVKGNADAIALRELTSNKKTSLVDNSDTFYPTQKAVKTAVDAKVTKIVSVDNNIPRFNGIAGELQASAITALDDGNVGIGTQTPLGSLHVYNNVADATTTLTVNKNNASATGKILELQFNGTTKIFSDKDGYFGGQGFYNIASSNNSVIQSSATGAYIQRNVADANHALVVNQANASSTGDILKAQWQSIDRFNIAYDGTVSLSNDKWLRAKDYAGTGYVNMFKVNADNSIDVGGQLNVGTLNLPEDSGLTSLVNAPVSATPTDGTEMAYTMNIDSDVVLKVHALSNGAGGVDTKAVIIATENGAVPDTSLANNQSTFYLDEASNTLVVKVKYSTGVVKTGTIALA